MTDLHLPPGSDAGSPPGPPPGSPPGSPPAPLPGWWRAADGRWYPAAAPPPPPPVGSPTTKRTQTLGALSMVAGLVGVLGGWLPLFGIVFAWLGPVAVALGFSALGSSGRVDPALAPQIRRSATVGIVAGTFATCLFLLWAGVFVWSFAGGGDPFRGL